VSACDRDREAQPHQLREHLENYRDFAELQQAFADFANKVPFYGSVIACADDSNLAAMLPRIKRRLTTYGLENADAVLVGTDVALGSFGARCTVHRRGTDGTQRLGTLELAVPGRHNLQNALGALAAAEAVGVEFDRAIAALKEFQGAERRFERVGEAAGVLVVDDYGHHPTEIAAVLAAARATLDRRLVVAFQPHRYSRTQRLLHEFGPSLKEADEIVLTDIYAASEEPIEGVTLEALADAVRHGSGRPVHVAAKLDDVVSEVLKVARPGDAVITLGAGSIGALPQRLLEALTKRGANA
jgi:UDP-N-acetylmuramate--alanine ligase